LKSNEKIPYFILGEIDEVRAKLVGPSVSTIHTNFKHHSILGGEHGGNTPMGQEKVLINPRGE
jgi:hypothetical protein